MILRFILFNLCFLPFTFTSAQGCCSGGGSNPIAGGAATGVTGFAGAVSVVACAASGTGSSVISILEFIILFIQ